MALKRYKRGQTPVTGRPADYLEPELESAWAAIKDFSTDIGDALTVALYPIDGLKFVKSKHEAKAAATGAAVKVDE